MTAKKQTTTKGSKKGKAEGGKGGQAGQSNANAVAYARRAYDAALAHFEKYHDNPFALSRLAVVYGGSRPGDVHMVVTLARKESATLERHVREYIEDAEVIARTLEDPGCSEEYRRAFGAVFTDLCGLSRVGWTDPAAVRFLLPLILCDLDGNAPAQGDFARQLLTLTLREVLNSDEVSERTRTVNA